MKSRMEDPILYLVKRSGSLGVGLVLLICSLAALELLANASLLDLCSADYALLSSIELEGKLVYSNGNAEEAARDFGGMKSDMPRAVLYPASVEDIARLIKAIYEAGSSTNLTVAARGHAHSIHGQAQAKDGVVIEMSALRGITVHKRNCTPSTSSSSPYISCSEAPYADVRGGELWIDVLQETLKHGLAPKSWTDYLYLSVGGTLSNAGVSGQAHLHGPQISNVYQLEVVTGKGDLVVCSPHESSDLFYAALGGLGQFGIITTARVALEPAPQRVKWIRALYSDWDAFVTDQEYLISQPQGRTFDYVEGFVVTKYTGSLIDNWRSSLFRPQKKLSRDNDDLLQRVPASDVLYYLEVTLNYNESEADSVDERVATLLEPLHWIPSSVYSTDLSYVEFLDRVHTGELKLRAKGLWDIPHPWLNLFVPRSKVAEFNAGVFKQILASKGGGPVIIYPMNRSKWDSRTSAVIPDEDVFYLVALLRSPSTVAGEPTTHDLMEQNETILRFCKQAGIEEKQYLPSLSEKREWQRHFGSQKWAVFVERKARYDPAGLLSPGQNMFRRAEVWFKDALL